jgi:hypothetical protein
MYEKVVQYENNLEFLQFLNREFDKSAVSATMEELAEFAFGNVDAAIKAFEEQKKNSEAG